MTDTITVNGVNYDIEREQDRGGSGEETLTLRDYDMDLDEFIDPFPGLHATLGYEQFDHAHFNPRDWSNVGTMAVSYRGYDLGDEDIAKIDFEVECPNCDGEGGHSVITEDGEQWAVCEKCDNAGTIALNPVDYFKQERGARVVLGLTVYEHSGITMRAGDVTLPWDTDRWDTSFVGFIYDTPEQVKQCMGDNVTDEQIEQALRDEVKTYASYLEGDVTYFVVQDDETGFSESCGGYVGDHEQCEKDCLAALETAVEKRLAEYSERAHWAARDVMTEA